MNPGPQALNTPPPEGQDDGALPPELQGAQHAYVVVEAAYEVSRITKYDPVTKMADTAWKPTKVHIDDFTQQDAAKKAIARCMAKGRDRRRTDDKLAVRKAKKLEILQRKMMDAAALKRAAMEDRARAKQARKPPPSLPTRRSSRTPKMRNLD
ncbi:hypothetical protein OC834_006397 [Tilletia horrida]|uniref:Uncharacterized protein n=1 Tax=Tilletia horrida TaxID=155126 RepID=A0AAN6JIM9_9BASI|nr:hypothetical protein OC834_006397 [Tilletia horrida]KAK0525779.1 hypothetical protein OC842_005398 [Tilletia horrida]KAK0536130.1 hypothetical protein OC835_002144 [Tilletia horrida]